jgi:hypothetical protein
MSTTRADPVENLCVKINFAAESASFARRSHGASRFVIHFACATPANT